MKADVFGIHEVAVADDHETLVAQTASLGPAMIAAFGANRPSWVAIFAGKLKGQAREATAAVRIAVADPDWKTAAKQFGVPLREVIRSNVASIGFDVESLPSGVSDHEPAQGDPVRGTDWLRQLLKPGRQGPAVVDVSGYIPRLNPIRAQRNVLWMSRFLSALHEIEASSAGVLLVLRPFDRPKDPSSSSLIALRRHLESVKAVGGLSEGESSNKSSGTSSNRGSSRRDDDDDDRNKSSGTGRHSSEGTSESLQLSYQYAGSDSRARALAMVNECLRSGAWWASIRAFGTDSAVAQQVAAVYWACIANVGRSTEQATTDYPRVLDAGSSPADGDFKLSDDLLSKTFKNRTVAEIRSDERPPYHSIGAALKRHGIDLLLHESFDQTERGKGLRKEEELQRLYEHEVTKYPSLVVPGSKEVLVSGERVSTLFQLPCDPNPLVDVTRGFGYTFVPRPPASPECLTFGRYCPGGLAGSGLRGEPARMVLKDLRSHMLVVGATGSGKTTSVVSVLRGLRKQTEAKVPVAVLEGAKREYRHYREELGIAAESHYDLMERHLTVNLFQHPDTVAPEAHISQVASLFEATLDLPAPLPSLMREGISRAYNAYHAEADPLLKALHPIQFWLSKAILEVAKDCGYEGEIKNNVDAALRTRIRGLALGASGAVLAGTQPWDEVAKTLTSRSILVELESIADHNSRSLVMSLFVLFYRYALQGGEGLRNVLVLEEAHRIIGKPSGTQEASPAQEYFGNLLGEVRALGCGLVISDQSPSRLIDDAMRNTNTKLIMRLVSGEDIRAAVEGAGLPEEARHDIPRLKTFQALYVSPQRNPGVVQVPRPTGKEPDGKIAPLDMGVLRRRLAAQSAVSATTLDFIRRLVNEGANHNPLFALEGLGLDVSGAMSGWLAEARKHVDCHCGKDPCRKHQTRMLMTILARRLSEFLDGTPSASLGAPDLNSP